MRNQEIKCNVKTCKHNDKSRYCTLSDIVVGNDSPIEAHTNSDTECVSFDAE